MSYLANVSLTDNGIKEERSVLFIKQLLLGKAKTPIETEDKIANIDGYIELLDSTKRICGKMTVQVKTVNKAYEGQNKFPCPTSLFAYAEVTTDNVFLLAVDHLCNKVLWKHISKKLLKENRDKESQGTITIHFNNDEELRNDNVDETLQSWIQICKTHTEFLYNEDEIVEENKQLRDKLLQMPINKTTLNKADITEIQTFSDEYNRLLDNEFKYIKRVLFPNTWKRGIAIYDYSDNSLEYSLFNIKVGELVAPILQLPKQSIFGLNHNHDFASFSCSDNKIKGNARMQSLEIIKKNVEDFLKKQSIIPFDEEFLKEYIHDFVDANRRLLHMEKYSELNVSTLLNYFRTKYPDIEKHPVRLISGGRSIYLNTVYDAIMCLMEFGYETIPYPYPRKGNYGSSGMVYDSFSSSGAFEKSKLVILNTIRAYQNFIQSEFPMLAAELDAFYGGNLIAVFVDYSNPAQNFIFQIYFFKSDQPSNKKVITIEEVTDSKILKENSVSSPSDLFIKQSVVFNGQKYSAFRGGGLNDMTILFGKYNCLTYFYELLNDHFKEYFKEIGL